MTARRRIVIPGGTGQIGRLLAQAFHDAGDAVTVLSRQPRPAPWRVVPWDGETTGRWIEELEGADAVVNLAGRSVNCRYNRENRREILESRLRSTQAVGDAIARASHPPRVWLQASTATIYAHSFDRANDESTGVIGGNEADAPSSWRFSIDVARTWEEACRGASVAATRKVLMRSAITLSPEPGGAFDALAGLVRAGLGGPVGDGRQFVSWIHGHDFVRAVNWLIERDDVEGVVNVASPNPLPNAEFMRTLRQVAGSRVGMPIAGWMLDVGASLRRTETELLLKSRRVVPGRLLENGFAFVFPDWPTAAADLWKAWRDGRSSARESHARRSA
jgi:uncharacterized protein (TIGR01777 family)